MGRLATIRRQAVSCLVAALACAGAARAPAQVPGLALQGLQPGGARAGSVLPDAFRSPFDDEDGWWSRVPAAGSPRLEATYANLHPVSRRLTGGDGYAHDRRLRTGVVAPLAALPGRWWGGVEYENQDLVTEVDASKSGTRLAGAGELVTGGLRGRLPGPGVTVQATVPVWRDGALDRRVAGAGVRLEPAPELSLQVARTWLRGDARMHATILDESLDCDLNLREDAWHTDLRLAPWRRFALELSSRDARYEPIAEPGPAKVYAFTPGGESRVWSATGRYAPWAGHTFLARFQEADFDLEAGLSWGGQQFGWLTYGRGYQRSRLLAWRHGPDGAPRWQLEWEDVWLTCRARAKIESWPFTDTVVDLLGVRQIARAEVDARWRRWTATAAGGLGGGRWRAGLSWFRCRPQATLDTYRPAVLVFGRADERHDELAVERLDLLALLLEAAAPLAGWELGLSLQQFLYGGVKEPPRPESPEQPPARPDAPRVESGWWGGTYLQLRIVHRFS